MTAHEYDLITPMATPGGNLMFLSANNFFHKVYAAAPGSTVSSCGAIWGGPEAALVGVEYLDWFRDRFANAP